MEAEPPAKATSDFTLYIGALESRLDRQHRAATEIPAPTTSESRSAIRLRRGELIVEELTPSGGAELPGALLHHWSGMAFAAGAKVEDFERLMKDFNAYPQLFSPQVIQARVAAQQGDRVQAVMRVRQRRGITVVMDTAYDVSFGRVDAHHGYSASRSTRISEIDAAGTASEHALNANEEHGFLWRQNIYWTYVERDGGLYMQVGRYRCRDQFPLVWAGQCDRLWRACRGSRWNLPCGLLAMRFASNSMNCRHGSKKLQ